MTSTFIAELSKYIFDSIVINMANKSRIKIEGFDSKTAFEVAADLNSLLALNTELNSSEYAIKCLTSESSTSPWSASIEQAVEYRNHKNKVLILSPEGMSSTAGSLRDFDNRNLSQIYSSFCGLLLDGCTEEERSIYDLVLRNSDKATSSKSIVEYISATKENSGSLGLNLWRLGLIPDARAFEDFRSTLSINRKTANAIAGKSKPLANAQERLNAASISEGAFRNRLAIEMETLPQNFSKWLENISTGDPVDMTFEHWEISEIPSSEIEKILIVPFRSSDGKADKACKLTYHELTNELVYTKELHVTWSWEPQTLESVTHWLVEVAPMGYEDATPIYSKSIRYGSRKSLTIKGLNLEESALENDRFIVRISALNQGEALSFESGGVAVALSEDFIIDIDGPDVQANPSKTTDRWISEGLLRAVIQRKLTNLTVGTGSYDQTAQLFKLPVGLSHVLQIGLPAILRNLENIVKSNPEQNIVFSLKSSHGGLQTVGQIVREEVPTSSNFLRQRLAFFEALNTATDPTRQYASTAEWNSDLRKALTKYVDAYIELLNDASHDSDKVCEIDTLTVTVDSPKGLVTGMVILQFHPLRLLWMSQHDDLLQGWIASLDKMEPKSRAKAFDIALAQKISPMNNPVILVKTLDSGTSLFNYAEELGGGAALFLNSEHMDHGETASAIKHALGIKNNSQTEVGGVKAISKYFNAYSEKRFVSPGIRIASVNASDGAVVANAVQDFLKNAEISKIPRKWWITAFSEVKKFSNPLLMLTNWHKEYSTNTSYFEAEENPIPGHGKPTLLNPDIRLAERELGEFGLDQGTYNFGTIQNLSRKTLANFSNRPVREDILGGLVVPLLNVSMTFEDKTVIYATQPAPRSNPRSKTRLPGVAEAFHFAASEKLLGAGSFASMELSIDNAVLDRLNSLHEKSDWVVTIDKHLGSNIYEEELSQALSSPYVLDYSPDFIEGFGDRVTLTTTKQLEMENILKAAMRRLGLENYGVTASRILKNLSRVSGRLALQLLKEDNRALESMGLAVVITHLQQLGKLSDCIIIPVDSHHDIFGMHANLQDEGSQRCDLIVLRFSDDAKYSMELIEVKARTGVVPITLPMHMAKQIERTWSQLKELIFDKRNVRIDEELQWSRWNSLVHFYLDRAVINGFVSDTDVESLHEQIEVICHKKIAPVVSRTGYIVNLDGGVAKTSHDVAGMALKVIDASVLESTGFTTIASKSIRDEDHPSSPDKSDNSQVSHQVASGDLPLQGVQSISAEVESQELPDDTESGEQTSKQKENFPEMNLNLDDVESAGSMIEAPESNGSNYETVVIGTDSAGQEITWSAKTSGSPHIVVVGIPGQGKSFFTRKFIASAAEVNVPSLVFDFHGDMSVSPPPNFTSVDVASNGLPINPFAIEPTNYMPVTSGAAEIAEILESIFRLGPLQKRHVTKAIKNAYLSAGWADDGSVGAPVTMDDFKANLEIIEVAEKNKNASARLEPFTDYQLFRDFSLSGEDFSKSNGIIFDVSKFSKIQELKLTAGAFLLRKIYNDMYSWGMTDKIRLTLVLDEAHLLSKNPTIPKLMKEGRKYGIAVMLISQSIDDFPSEVPENAGTKIAFRTNFPSSKKVGALLRSRGASDLSEAIENLRVGEAFISSQELSEPQLMLPS